MEVHAAFLPIVIANGCKWDMPKWEKIKNKKKIIKIIKTHYYDGCKFESRRVLEEEKKNMSSKKA